jgi:hypothetical protein
MFRSTIAVLKKTAAILSTTGFFAAALFLAADLYSSANAAPTSTQIDVEPSLLLALDKPQRPAHKLHLPDVASLTDDELQILAHLPAPDLTAELNGWTYTQAGLFQDFLNFGNALFQYEVALVRQQICNALGWIITGLSIFNIGGILSPLINELTMIQNSFSCYC